MENPKSLLKNLKSHLENFYHWETTTPDSVFLRQPYGETWKTLTYAEAGQEARKMAAALKSMGLKKGDHIGIISKNCYHWILADIAIMMIGGVSIPYYTSLPKNKLKEVISSSDIKALFIGKLEKWEDRVEAISNSLKVIRFPHYANNTKIEIGEDWDELVAKHEAISENYTPDLNDLWTILFTSGTTGKPKGVMHPFKNPAMIFEAERKTSFVGTFDQKNPTYFSFLPLNHVAERIGIETAAIITGGSLSFGESINTFAKNLQDTQPTTFFAVPRIWTKFYQGVTSKMPEKKLNLLLKIPFISGKVKEKLRVGLGLKDAVIVATGAAITPKYIKDFYKKIDIHLVEAYGMTEVCGSISNGPSKDTPADSVGVAFPYCEIKIHPESQEILMKSPWVMTGYYKEPEKTAEVLKDGWMYSGDRGTLDENGYLRVIGRVKDIFKTTKGKYVDPNPIEAKLAPHEFIEQICVTGNGCPQPIALINLSEQGLNADKSAVEAALVQELERVNSQLASFEKISTLIINGEQWSEQNSMLTPTLKVRRVKIDDCYCEEYINWHEKEDRIIWA